MRELVRQRDEAFAAGVEAAAFLKDLAGRLFRTATPTMGFDQNDTDELYRIARSLTPPQQKEMGE